MTENQQQTEANNDRLFNVERIYIKDVSFEAPLSPQLFLEQWEPEIHVDLNIERNKLDDATYEIVLFLTVTAKRKEEIALLVEVKQAGVFTIKGFDEETVKMISGVQCPSILYPYAQQICSQLVHQGGYPALYLAPVNFEAMYMHHQKEGATDKTDA